MKNEKLCVTYSAKSGQVYQITQDIISRIFKLYKINNGKQVDTKKKAKNPLNLEKYML